MGTFNVAIQVGDPQSRRFEPIEALVDTGATCTVLPGPLLRRLGVVPHRRSLFELADGRQAEWEIGRTWIQLNGQREMTLVVFGEDDSRPILGAVTLEEFLMSSEPNHERLYQSPGRS